MDTSKKIAGLLAPLFSLRGGNDLGAGDAGTLREFVAWAARHGFAAVQILPVNEMCADFSPYNLRSAFALDPLVIETTPEAVPWLRRKKFEKICEAHDVERLRRGDVDYPRVFALKRALLEAAFAKFNKEGDDEDFDEFCEAENEWLEEYALYRALVDWGGASPAPEGAAGDATTRLHDYATTRRTDGTDSGEAASSGSSASVMSCSRVVDGSRVVALFDAPPGAICPSPALARAWLASQDDTTRREFVHRMRFFAFVQWLAHSQWRELNAFARALGVLLIGDVPVGVSIESHDVWAWPELFNTSLSCGAPPEGAFQGDAFTARWGQNWGFPLYNWRTMSEDNFAWWRRRLRLLRRIFPLLRVDHALGFFRIYSFPWRPQENEWFAHLSDDQARAVTGGALPRFVDGGDETAESREHNRRHGEFLMRVFLEEVDSFVAEDLGTVPPYVRPTLAELGIPGFKIPQWERNEDGSGGGSLVAGTEYPRLSFATFATHDHPPLRTMWNELFDRAHAPEYADRATREMRELLDFCGAQSLSTEQAFNRDIHLAFLRGLFACNSWLAVHMITDLFGSDMRVNIPGVSGGNWTARIPAPIAQWDALHADILRELPRMPRFHNND